MRKITLILFVLLVAITGNAQQMLYSPSMQEALIKRNNKIYYIKTLTDSLITPNGMVVYANGKIKDAMGRIFLPADGDCLKFKGVMVVFYQTISLDDVGMRFRSHFVRVWTILNKPVTLQNGIYAMPNGTLELQNGNYVKMKNKQFMGFNGNEVVVME